MRRNLLAISSAALLAFVSAASVAAEKVTVEQIFAQKERLAGKQVEVTGKVVKMNEGIMERNFIHISDGTGKEGSNDLTVTSDEIATPGETVTITGEVAVNRDFGFGYNYPVLVEKAHITQAKK